MGVNMFNFKLDIPTYKEWKVQVEKYQEQVTPIPCLTDNYVYIINDNNFKIK